MTKEENKDLEKLTRTKLVEEAKKYADVVGASGMKKEELVEAIKAEKEKAGEEVPETSGKSVPAKSVKKKEKKAPDREAVKAALGELKRKRQEALEGGDSVQLKRLRRRYKKMNRTLRRTPVSQA